LPKSPETEWVKVSDQSLRYEHTRWLNGNVLNDIMGPKLLRQDDLIFEKAGGTSESRFLAVLARSDSDFVAVVNDDKRFQFRRLIERRLVLEKLAEQEVQNYSQSK
jgi:hypothetical protein